ncbi:TIGR04282 family arsenosugar biosynthesis glycosyltransferase [Halomonas sp. M5N1S17]|uniref:TIGR04282 family arsenosugar biosynthesis glycosyltransferase n=1 Tax=Halomonas alkalisoli TaxID=2907158 RepID=UPI001EFFE154|nr:TIGR04282 family arsenosugar biosynthesis glycosyltransferase [Halomonas alkalisoli]MCE9662517.1 TIGR04282 family arsenosugar biosynthesis glycosyltransferase [Halomonas alkalisoli]
MCADVMLAVLAKAPLPGQAKTRLIPTLGAEGAARLHERLLRRTLEIARATMPRVTLWTALAHHHPLFLELADTYRIELRPQPHGDLGQRMLHALAAMPGPGLVIGTDCPVLTPTLLRRCHAALNDADVVCLPAEDGGYGLIAMHRTEARLFSGIDWSTERVMSQTAHAAAKLGLRLRCLDTVWDVDRPEDLARLATHSPELLVDLDDPTTHGR